MIQRRNSKRFVLAEIARGNDTAAAEAASPPPAQEPLATPQEPGPPEDDPRTEFELLATSLVVRPTVDRPTPVELRSWKSPKSLKGRITRLLREDRKLDDFRRRHLCASV
ncbi:hypothetical protein AAG570_004209 [Ranatra chinensis]|uniref:Uncharacterized protein n=1 Tax=Ranatra chinensis TaxID=642074 RepID=A0ABD0Y376_9HEMI